MQTEKKHRRVVVDRSPRWLAEALEDTRRTREFRRKLDAVAQSACSLARLRRERERIGFVPLPFSEYFQGIAGALGVSITPILRRLGISDLSRLSVESAEAWAHLGRGLGLSLRELLLHARIGLAQTFGLTPLPLMAARRKGGSRASDLIAHCEAALTGLDSLVPPDARLAISALESAFRTLSRRSGESEA